ncbi:hypothetical protein V2J09_018225 [Rumex salicifolius]
MSFNQSKSDKNESQYRKPGGGGRSSSSGQQRTFTGSSGRGGGGFTAPPLVTNPSSTSSSRSLKKIHNAQGVQSRVAAGSVNVTSTASAPVQNAVTSKTNDMANQRNPVPIPKAPPSQSSTMTSNSTTTPTTPAKGDGAKGFSLQFGSISPGLMNGMQVPARTTSAPPNIAELKRDQAQHAASKVAAAVPLASVPKTQLPRMDVPVSQHIAGEPNAALKVKRDVPVTSALPASHAQKPPVLPMAGMPIQVPYPQPSMSMQFGGPNPQMQSQGMPTSSLPMPMQISLQMGNPTQVQQQMFITGLQHPMMQPQALMHQSQNLGFNPQMTQLSHQMGSPGMNIAPQFSPQQPVKYGSARKAVKITHPETREEVSLDKKIDVHSDGTSAPRTHHNVPPQSYPSGHPIGYYPNTYSSGSQYFAAQSSGHPISSAPLNPIPQQPSRFNFPASQAPHNVPYVSRSPPNSLPASRGGKVASSNLDSSRVTQSVVLSSPVLVTIKPASEKSTEAKVVEKGQPPRTSRSDAEISSLQIQKDSHTNADKNLAHPKFGSEEMRPESATIDDNVAKSSTTLSTDGKIMETAARSESVKDDQKKQVNKGPDHSVPQFGVQASSGLSQAAVSSDHSLKMLSSSLAEVNKSSSGAGQSQSTGHIHLEQSSSLRAAPVDESSSGANSGIQSPAGDAFEVVGAGGAGGAIGAGVDLSSEQPDPLQAETSGTGKPGKENIVGEKQNCGTLVHSLKQAEMDEKPNLNLELEGNADLVDTSVKHVQLSTPSHAVTDKIDREASKPSINASDYVSGSEAVTEVQSAGCEGDATAVHVKALEGTTRAEKESLETARPTSSSGSASISNKSAIDSNKTKTASTRGKKNLKQILQKADAQGTTSDLYMAYKRPDEKVETNLSIGSSDNISNYEMKAVSELDQDVSLKEKDDGSKAEPDDWEDAADLSTPKLQSMSKRSHELTEQEVGTAKKYTRDFLMTFSEQCTSLPEGFKDNSDIAVILLCPSSSSSRGAENTSSARITDRPSSGHKVDRRGSGLTEADRWNKHPSPREMGQDSGYGSMQMGFRPGQGGNVGVLRNPRAQQSAQYPILSGPSGPMHSMQRNNPEADRWRNVNFKGLMPPPQTNMHKAERKYQVGKVTDEEQAKQRKLKGILNKLTPQNFDKLFAQVKEVSIDNVKTLEGVISQIFDKALMEPTFCEMYSNFCYELSLALPDLSVDDEKVTFKRLLLDKCQEEFERGEKEEEEANKDDSGEEIKLTDGEKEERRLQARRRMLGNIRLIGELYKKSMLTERIMHECIRKLLGQYPNCVEEDIESLCKLMSTIGEMIDHPRGKEYMDKYFGLMAQLSNDMKLSSRVRFMLKDAIDLRKNKWQQRRKVEGPKKIEDVHRDAAQEKHAQSSRLNRGPSMGSGTRRGQPVDFSPRGSGMLSSPVSQGGSFRGLPQVRNYPMQDVRTDERNSFNSRNISVPLPQRPLGDGSITLGPQGGLARGMSIRGQSSVSAVPSAEHSLSHGDIRRTGGLNGFSSMTDRGTSISREEPVQRLAPPEKFGGPQSSMQDHAASSMNKDRSVPASTPSRGQGILTGQNLSSESVLPDERLREKSIAAIREFYSAKDEKEVDTCVRELNAPRFYPSVISIWVNDSFDRRDPERVLLNKLIVNLSKSRTGQLFMPDQLIKGFEAVLTNLEDAVSDAPKAPEYLGRLLSMLIVENILSLKEIGGLLYEGGEEPGCLREAGLAGDVLGSILENIESEKDNFASVLHALLN